MQFSALWPKFLVFVAALACLPCVQAAEDRPAYLAGYSDDAAYNKQIEELSKLDLVSVKPLGESVGGRKLWLVTVGKGDVDQKPAIAVVGGTDGKYLLGTELTLRMIRSLAEQGAKADSDTSKLLDHYTFYFLPRPDPDTAEKAFKRPLQTPAGNDRKTDDDRDFEVGEDPADDLNGDGFITQLRVEDEKGEYIEHPSDPRVLIKADPKKNERGKYRLLIEGRDDDGDEQYNEDGAGGVSLNRNFPFGYKPFLAHGGEHAASEPETRAVLDFFYDHPNIAIVLSFSPDNNLFHPWKASGDKERIRKSVFPDDASLIERLAGDYKKLHGGSDPPAAAGQDGSFSAWAYYHYGRWSLSSLGWWPPKTEAKKAEAKEGDQEKPADASGNDNAASEKKPNESKSDEKRGADELNLLRWLEANNIDGFVPWAPVEHPDFPGRASVGGFKPLVGLNPPAAELDSLAEKHVQFLEKLPSYLPQIAIIDAKAEPLGGGLYRVSAKVINRGYLPTMPEMGRENRQPQPLQLSLDLPKDAQLLQGHARVRVDRLASGQHAERAWLVRFSDQTPEKLKLRAWSPSVGSDEVEVELK